MDQDCEKTAGQIIDLAQWLASAPGRHLSAWSQERCDQALGSANCFGWHALQMGMPAWPLLRNSRAQHHWVATQGTNAHVDAAAPSPDLLLDFTALPFAEASIDLIVLPYALEASNHPHTALREAARVLVPEGHLLMLGFNPASLWGLQQKKRMLTQRITRSGALAAQNCQTQMQTEEGWSWQQAFAPTPPVVPGVRQWVSYRKLRSWLQLLGFEIGGGRFGCYRPIVRNAQWFDRLQWLEAAGDRWWPFWGGVYFLHVIKRVHGARLLRPDWAAPPQTARATAPATRHTHAKASNTNTSSTCKQ